jgi:hypothetical protein
MASFELSGSWLVSQPPFLQAETETRVSNGYPAQKLIRSPAKHLRLKVLNQLLAQHNLSWNDDHADTSKGRDRACLDLLNRFKNAVRVRERMLKAWRKKKHQSAEGQLDEQVSHHA